MNPKEVRVVSFNIMILDAKPWDISSPRIYEAYASLDNGDTLFVKYGRRTIKILGISLLLNDKPVFLKGVNWHCENSISGGAMSPKEIFMDLNLIKKAGANFIRLSHYNRHPAVYEWADENGLLVMDEVENYWMKDYQLYYQTKEYGLGLALAVCMAWNQMNHPSVIIWSVANESETHTPLGIDAFKIMYSNIKKLDLHERPVTFASWGSQKGWREESGAFNFVDIIAINEYFGFFYGKSKDLIDRLKELHMKYPSKLVLISESGMWAIWGNHGDSSVVGTEEYQKEYFKEHWNIAVSFKDYLVGYTWLVFADHLSRHQPNSAIPYVSTMGIVDRERRPKLIFYYFSQAEIPSYSYIH
ncbi:MAG: hypothetical protein CBR30_00380 [Dictyoglomus sp. NZ13-RE01]|nr:MAG: hypothetical protein CBR30_00380 [Dictyoglomus sp. NZ13-RE01]